MEKKICTKCGVEKNFEEMTKRKKSKDGMGSCCKKCKREAKNKDYKKNSQRYIIAAKKYYTKNKENIAIKSDIYYSKNRDEILKKKKTTYDPEKKKRYNQQYYKDNKKEMLIEHKEWTKRNKKHLEQYREKNKKTRNKLLQERRLKDNDFRLKGNIKSAFFRDVKNLKNGSFCCYMGVSIDSYIEKLSKDELWDVFCNGVNEIHLDHIIPVSIYNFNNINDVKKCWDIENLRFLHRTKNIQKSNKINMELIKKHKIEHLLPEGFEL